jgi:hypothetical protein
LQAFADFAVDSLGLEKMSEMIKAAFSCKDGTNAHERKSGLDSFEG